MAKETKETVKETDINTSIQEKQLELLNKQMDLLKKPDQAKEFEERVAKYEASKEAREAMTKEIEATRMSLMQRFNWLKIDDIIVIESNIRRAKELQAKQPNDATKLFNHAKVKIEQSCPDQGFKVDIRSL